MGERRFRALRGATTAEANTAAAIHEAAAALLAAVVSENALAADDLVSAIFTVTPDLDAAFPATAARQLGFADLPVLCATEIPVPGAVQRCIRVLLHAELAAEAVPRHVYLRGARALRPDLTYE